MSIKCSSKSMKLVYLASPYSYKSRIPFLSRLIKKWRHYQITKIAGKLHDLHPNVAFILPITMSHQTIKYMKNKGTDFEMWKERDLFYITKSKEVWVIGLKGYYKSKGVKEEVLHALHTNKKVFLVNPKTFEKHIITGDYGKI